jgi:hypothetical protein
MSSGGLAGVVRDYFSGAFASGGEKATNLMAVGQANGSVSTHLNLNVSRVVKTGPDNAPRTLAKRLWRLVSL